MLKDEIILVTGAGRGIGRGICEAVAEAGGTVAATDVDVARAAETAAEIERTGSRAIALEMNVGDLDSVAAALESTSQQLGQVTGWVNNAGVLRMGPALGGDAGDWDAQFEVNARAVFLCSRLAVEYFVERGVRGAIVNVASNAGKVGYPNMAAYNASKAAVVSLTRSLAAEWAGHGINVNAVCPGGVETPMLHGVAEWIGAHEGVEAEELLPLMRPAQLGRHVQPIEVGRVVAFLLSESATIIRGQSINVDGGETPY